MLAADEQYADGDEDIGTVHSPEAPRCRGGQLSLLQSEVGE
jgi:hypothetical protein